MVDTTLNPVTIVNSAANPVPVSISVLQNVNAQTGTTYTVLSTDIGKLVTFSNAAAIAVTLPVATASGFTAGFWFEVQNLGVGTVTITPTTSTINGAATMVLTTGSGASITSDGTNYFAMLGDRTFVAGQTIKSGVAATTMTANAATVTSYFLQCTTPSLSTAAGASQAETITLTGVAATDIVFVTKAGGSNTTKLYTLEAVATTNTVTVTIYNIGPSVALNGTVIFNVWIMKA